MLSNLKDQLKSITQESKDLPKPDPKSFEFYRKPVVDRYPRFSKASKEYRNMSKSKTCEICQKTFKHKYILNSHLRVIHKKNPYYCTKCGDHFEVIKDLKIHIEIVHLNSKKVLKYKKPKEFIDSLLKRKAELQQIEKEEGAIGKCLKQNAQEAEEKQKLMDLLKDLTKQEKMDNNSNEFAQLEKTSSSTYIKQEIDESSHENHSTSETLTNNISQQNIVVKSEQQQQQYQQNLFNPLIQQQQIFNPNLMQLPLNNFGLQQQSQQQPVIDSNLQLQMILNLQQRQLNQNKNQLF